MTIHKTMGLVAAAALVIPAGAAAHDGPGSKGHKGAKQPQCGKLAGFNVAGTGLEAGGLTFADGKATGTLTLDVARANRPALAFLGLTTLPAADKQIALTADALVVRFRGVNGLPDVKPTDRVKIQGRVSKARPGCPAATPTLDVRRITVTRADAKASHASHGSHGSHS